LRVTGPPGVHSDLPQIELLDRIDQKMHQMIRRHPIAQVRRQQQGGVTVDVHEFGSHARAGRSPHANDPKKNDQAA
jgi:hypothetical protein